MTEGVVAYLDRALKKSPLAITGNSEADESFDRNKVYRDQTRVHQTVLRAIIEDLKGRATEDNTIVPPLPTDRWASVVNAVKGGIVGAALAMHLLEAVVIAWLVIDAVRR